MPVINIEIDRKTLGDQVTVDEFILLEEGDLRTIRNILGKFIVDDNGVKVSEADGAKIVGKLSLNQLQQAAQDFITAARDSAATPQNGAV